MSAKVIATIIGMRGPKRAAKCPPTGPKIVPRTPKPTVITAY